MTALSQRLSVGQTFASATLRLLVPLVALHGAMFFYDVAHPERFMRADRAGERLQAITGLADAVQSGHAIAYLSAHGIVGDWLPQAVVYLAGGQYLLIAVQVILALASVVWVREIGLRLGLEDAKADGAALLYALLPHTLVFTHELASEAVFVPLVVLGFRCSLPQRGAAGGLALGLATLVRPVTALWPLLAASIQRAPYRSRALFVAAAAAPLAAWMTFVLLATGEFSMGRSSHDLGNNLYYRMQRMGATLPEAERPPVKPQGHTQASIGEYLHFVLAHPAAAAAHSVRDAGVMVFKSGIERVTLDYLDLFPQSRDALQQSEGGWRTSLEEEGALATLAALLRAQPGLVLSSALAAAVFTLFMVLALYGALMSARKREWLLLALFVLYVGATAQAVDAAHSRHRAPAEFALCLLAAAGWAALKDRKEKYRGR
jgi:hypothetical protein